MGKLFTFEYCKENQAELLRANDSAKLNKQGKNFTQEELEGHCDKTLEVLDGDGRIY